VLANLLRVAAESPVGDSGEAAPLAEKLKGRLDQELAEFVDALAGRALPPLDHLKQAALQDTIRRLEDRYLRDLKMEERLKFSAETDEEMKEFTEGLYQEALELNQRIKLNQVARGGAFPNAYQGR
jgi:hypothetical protein